MTTHTGTSSLLRTRTRTHRRGLSLIEIIVSIGLFALMATTISGAFLHMVAANDKARGIRVGMDNLNLAIEYMTREIRMGTNYHCNANVTSPPRAAPHDCPSVSTSGATSIVFRNAAGQQVVYALSGNAIQRAGPTTAGIGTFNITSTDQILIDNFTVFVRGAEVRDDNNPAFVSVRIAGRVPGRQPFRLVVQSSIAQWSR